MQWSSVHSKDTDSIFSGCKNDGYEPTLDVIIPLNYSALLCSVVRNQDPHNVILGRSVALCQTTVCRGPTPSLALFCGLSSVLEWNRWRHGELPQRWHSLLLNFLFCFFVLEPDMTFVFLASYQLSVFSPLGNPVIRSVCLCGHQLAHKYRKIEIE